MTDVRERVARAICEQNLLSTRQPTDAETMNSYWPSFKREADAALLACGYAEMRKAMEALIECHGDPEAIAAARSILERTGEK